MNDVDVFPYVLRLIKPWRSARGTTRVRQGFAVRVNTSYGDAAALPQAPASQQRMIARQLARPETRGPKAPQGPARHAWLQAALCEEARVEGTSLSGFLGRRTGRVPRERVHVNATISLANPPAAAREAVARKKEGYRTLKVKVGTGTQAIKIVEAVRAAVGSGVAIRVDPNGSWADKEAPRLLTELEPFDVEYVEQPIPPGRTKRLRLLASKSPVPIAPDEAAASLATIRLLLKDNVIEHVVLKPMLLGGPDLALQAIAWIEDAAATPIITDVVESGIGRAGALHVAALTKRPDVAHGLASGTQLEDDLLVRPLVPQKGEMNVPSGKGLGVKINEGAF